MVATAVDQAGNTATASLVFQTDLVRPEVRIEEPTRLVKGTTATFRAVADPSTVVGPLTFTWVRRDQTFPVAASIPWTLAATGRTSVRAQFDWPLPATTYTANVIVDTKRPELTAAVSRGATVRLRARDTGSGLATVRWPRAARTRRGHVPTGPRWARGRAGCG